MKVSELKNLLQSDRDYFLCDVRSGVEYEGKHLPEAENIPLDTIESGEALNRLPKDKSIILICKSGVRSQKALNCLKEAGYTNLETVEGGMDRCAKEDFDFIENKNVISLERQVRIAAGSLVVIGVVLSLFVSQSFIALSAFVGAGLVFAGITDTCGMGMLLLKAPWNKVK